MKPLTAPRRVRGTPLRRRRQMKTRRRWTWRSLFHAPIPQLVVLAAVLGGLYALATSRVFAISTVQVSGAPSRQSALFRRYCDCMGRNIFLTRPSDIRWRLGQIPYVDVRDVYERLPDRVVIDAVYRDPALLWRTTVATYTVDAAGEVLYDIHTAPVPTSTIPTTATLPLVYSPHDTTFVSGQHVAPGTVAVQMVLNTRALAPADIGPSLDVYHWSPYSGLTVHSRFGWWFSLGINLHDELQQRLNAVDDMYHKRIMQQRRCNYIDVRVIPQVYCNTDPQWNSPLGPGVR